MISAARDDDDFTIHLTYPTDEFSDQAVGEAVAAFFAGEKQRGRKYRVRYRKAAERSFTIALDS